MGYNNNYNPLRQFMNILVTGKSSFLFQYLIKSGIFDNDNLFEYEYDVDYTNIDMIYHFGSPSCEEHFKNKASMSVSMIDYTVKIVEQALANNAKIVFASSEGVYDVTDSQLADGINDQERYNLFKLAAEEYLISFEPNIKTCVLRIPRVYDLERKVGLVGKLLKNEVPQEDMNTNVSFITLDDFIEYATNSIDVFKKEDKGLIFEYNSNYWRCEIGQILDNLEIYWQEDE